MATAFGQDLAQTFNQIWTFKQISGSENKTLTLSGWAAPFGRPRRKPVITEELKQRNQKVRYPGRDGAPTRIFFGEDYEDMKIDGRWMDKDLGVGGANALAKFAEQFVNDQATLLISWGSVVQYQGVILELKIARESEAEIAWEMVLGCDFVVGTSVQPQPDRPTAQDQVTSLQQLGINGVLAAPKLSLTVPDWQPDFFEAINLLVGKIATAFSSVLKIANQISSIESATAGEVQSLLSAVHSLKTAVIVFKNTLGTAGIDASLIVRSADSDVNWFNWRTEQETQSANLIAITADLETFLNSNQQGTTRKTIVAVLGDTWESLSNRSYGAPDGAAGLRLANGIPYGTLPTSGRTYIVPQN